MKTGEIRNPGDPEPRKLIERTIRVDQAGEFGAVRIYRGPSLDRPGQWRGRPQDRRHGAGRARAQQGVRPPAG
jgi:ubiquinone biosynthesis monooxygenase Coq7